MRLYDAFQHCGQSKSCPGWFHRPAVASGPSFLRVLDCTEWRHSDYVRVSTGERGPGWKFRFRRFLRLGSGGAIGASGAIGANSSPRTNHNESWAENCWSNHFLNCGLPTGGDPDDTT